MKNYVQPGDNLTIPAPADVNAGDGVLAGKMFGVATGAALSGANVTIVRKGVFTLPKTSAQAWTVGAKVYWSGTECTTVASGNTAIGFAAVEAADPSEIGTVVLGGNV